MSLLDELCDSVVNEPTISYTHSGGLFNQVMPPTTTSTWSEFCGKLSHFHATSTDSEDAKKTCPTFTPAIFRSVGCERRDVNVTHMQLLVFDVDEQATPTRVEQLLTDLRRYGLAFVFHSTYKHGNAEGYQGYRLIIPADKPLDLPTFQTSRGKLFTLLNPPAKLVYGTDPSRPFFYPSHPTSRASKRVLINSPGKFFRHQDYNVAPATATSQGKATPLTDLPETEDAVDMAAIHKELKKCANKMKLGDPKRERLERMLAGRPIAPSGQRDLALQSLVGYLVFVLPDTTAVSTYLGLLERSIDAMAPYHEPTPVVRERIRDKVRRAFQAKQEARAKEASEREELIQHLAKLSTPPRRNIS